MHDCWLAYDILATLHILFGTSLQLRLALSGAQAGLFPTSFDTIALFTHVLELATNFSKFNR